MYLSSQIIHLAFVPESMQLVSVSESQAIQIWSLSIAQGSASITPVAILTASLVPTHAAAFHHRVCVAFTDYRNDRSIIQVFDTNGAVCFTHHNSHDHDTVIHSVVAHRKLRIFASATKAGVVKFWDEQNHLV